MSLLLNPSVILPIFATTVSSSIAIVVYAGNLRANKKKAEKKQKSDNLKEFKLIETAYLSGISEELKVIVEELGSEEPNLRRMKMNIQFFLEVERMIEKIEPKNMTYENEIFSNATSFKDNYFHMKSLLLLLQEQLDDIAEKELKRWKLNNSVSSYVEEMEKIYKHLKQQIVLDNQRT